LEKVNKIEQHGYVIPFNKSFSRITNERILLVGDAAALADPLTGEGISSAILSGKFAAEAIIEGGENNFKVEKLYNNKVKNSILKEHRYAKIIAVIAYSFPQLRALLFKKIGYPLSELMTDIIAGEKKYSTIMKNPLNYFKLIKSLFIHIT
jgi:flavin-dependent dehydrogenase